MKKLIIIGIGVLLIATSLLTGCFEESKAEGTLRLQITDKPGDYTITYAQINITKIEVHKSGEDDEELDNEYQNIDDFNDSFIANATIPKTGIAGIPLEFNGSYEDLNYGTENVSYNWSFGDGNFSDEQNVSHTYLINDTYEVNLTVTNDTGIYDWYIGTVVIGEDDDSGAGWEIIFDNITDPLHFDLIALQDEIAYLGEGVLEVGKYTQIRLTIVSANITVNDSINTSYHKLKIPSSKIKLIKPFWIYEGETTVLTLDFIIDESVHKTGNNKFIFRPTIKIIVEEPE